MIQQKSETKNKKFQRSSAYGSAWFRDKDIDNRGIIRRTYQRVSASIKNGFTLIELLTVIAIISLIVAFVIPNFKEGQRKSALRQAAQKVAQDIRRAQNMAMSGVNFTPGKTCGYGIHYKDQNTYVIFEDKDDDCAYGVGVFDPRCDGDICSVATDAFADEIVETITVPENRHVELAGSFFDILFVPPEPLTYINGFYPRWPVTIYLQLKSDNSVRKSVEVEFTGNVKIE